jgi:hypothetical protein
MSVASLEHELANWLKLICKNPKFRVKDISEWSSDERTVRTNCRPDETVLFVPQMGLWVAVMTANAAIACEGT